MAEHEAKVKISGESGEAVDATKKVSEAIEGMSSVVKERFELMNGIFLQFREHFSLLTEVVAGGILGERLSEMVMHVAELGESLTLTAQKIGISVEDLSRLRYAADIVGVGAETVTYGMNRLSRTMEEAKTGTGTAREAFLALGISLGDKSNLEVLNEMADKFKEMPDGANKTAIAMQIFGRSGAELVPFLNQGRDGIAALEKEADRLGVTMSTQTAESGEKLVQATKRLHAGFQGAEQLLVSQFLPAITDVAEGFSHAGESGSAWHDVIIAISNAIKGIVISMAAVYYTGVTVMDTLKAAWDSFAGTVKLVATVLYDAATGNFSAIKDDWTAITGNMSHQVVTDLKAGWQKAGKDFEDFANNLVLGPIKGPEKEKEKAEANPAGVQDLGMMQQQFQLKLDSLKAEAEMAETAEQRLAIEEQIAALWKARGPTFAKEYGQAEIAVAAARKQATNEAYQAELGALRVSEEENKKNLALRIQIAEQELAVVRDEKGAESREYEAVAAHIAALMREQADQQEKINQEIEAAATAHQVAMLNIQKQTIGAEAGRGEINPADRINQEQQIEDQIYAIKRAALEKQAALEDDPAKHQQLLSQMQALDDAHSAQQVASQQALVTAQTSMWRAGTQGIQNMWNQGLQAMLNGTRGWQNAHKAILGELSNVFSQTINQIVDKWIQQQLVAAITGKTAAAMQVASAAGVAGANAVASTAAIPVVGPPAAPAAGAAAFAEAMSFMGFASAAGGYDIPAGINPVTQLHAKEMVLPAHLADVIRGMAANGGGAPQHVHNWNVQAIDSQSFANALDNNSHHLAAAVSKAAMRNQL